MERGSKILVEAQNNLIRHFYVEKNKIRERISTFFPFFEGGLTFQ